MTHEDIIRIARETGWSEIGADLWGATNDGAMSTYALKRFAALIAAAQREECAKVCDEESRMHENLDRNGRSRHIDDAEVAKTCAAAIRARGKTNV